MTDTLPADIQSLNPSAIIEVFQIDLTALGDTTYYFHAGTNQLQQNLVWQGQTYQAWPALAKGFDLSTSGASPRPKLVIGNSLGTITALCIAYQDCVGGKVTRKRTLLKYLDAVNFPGGVNASADPSAELPDDIFFINRKNSETNSAVEFDLAAAHDVAGVQLPGRQIIQNLCPWRYRGGECGYAGTDYFNEQDVSVPSAGQDVCSKRLTGCKARFGENEELPFGGFPGAGLIS